MKKFPETENILKPQTHSKLFCLWVSTFPLTPTTYFFNSLIIITLYLTWNAKPILLRKPLKPH